MKKQFKTLTILLIGVATLMTISSCLKDNDDNYERQKEFFQKAITNSQGSWSGTLKFANQLGLKENEEPTSWNCTKDEKGYYITFSNFPISKIAKSIDIPATSTPETKALYDSLSFIKEGIAKLENISYKTSVGTTASNDPLWNFILLQNVHFTLNYLGKDHYYTLMQYKNTVADQNNYAYSFSSFYRILPEAMGINGVFKYLVETNKERSNAKPVKEFSPTQFLYTSTNHTK